MTGKKLDWPSLMRSLDLSSMIQAPMSVTEDNVAVYLAGYLARKLKAKFGEKCKECYQLWLSTEEEKQALSNDYIFFDQKQYFKDAEINTLGLTAPSEALLKATKEMEYKFRHAIVLFMSQQGVFENVYRVFSHIDVCNDIVCSEKCEDKVDYFRAFYARLRIHYDLKFKNRMSKSLKKETAKCKKLKKMESLAS